MKPGVLVVSEKRGSALSSSGPIATPTPLAGPRNSAPGTNGFPSEYRGNRSRRAATEKGRRRFPCVWGCRSGCAGPSPTSRVPVGGGSHRPVRKQPQTPVSCGCSDRAARQTENAGRCAHQATRNAWCRLRTTKCELLRERRS